TVGVDHTFVGDLRFKLISPATTNVTIINQAGGALNAGQNFCQTLLDDSAVPSIQSVTAAQAPFTGTFKPANPLSGFNGESANGTWTLQITDAATGDTGNVRAFSLIVSPFTCTPACAASSPVTITPSGPTTFCTGSNVTLTAP